MNKQNIWGDKKMKRLAYLRWILTLQPRRYRNLLRLIYKNRIKSIMEIGTYNGIHACQMIETASIFYPAHEIDYYGFDLFDFLSPEEYLKEFSKKPPSATVVRERLTKTGANIHLFVGNTKDTLPKFVEEFNTKYKQIDLVFIDGGHSIETINSDWSNVKTIMTPRTVVVFDDHYNNKEKEVSELGCQSLIGSLDTDLYEIEFLKPEDCFVKEWGILKINMIKISLRK